MNIVALPSVEEVLPVLAGCDLPVADISAASPPQFFGVRFAGSPVAVIGLEQFQSVGLLRSLAVVPGHRGQGLAKALVSHAESHAAAQGVESLFLLTTTAAPFFIRLGYRPASREAAPPAVRATAQFSGLCPSSSAFLSKRIGGANPDAPNGGNNC